LGVGNHPPLKLTHQRRARRPVRWPPMLACIRASRRSSRRRGDIRDSVSRSREDGREPRLGFQVSGAGKRPCPVDRLRPHSRSWTSGSSLAGC